MADTETFLPQPQQLTKLIEEFVTGIQYEGLEDAKVEDNRAWLRGWLGSSAAKFYEQLVEQRRGEESQLELMAEIAFWKAIADFYRSVGRYLLAEKLGFLPPRVI